MRVLLPLLLPLAGKPLPLHPALQLWWLWPQRHHHLPPLAQLQVRGWKAVLLLLAQGCMSLLSPFGPRPPSAHTCLRWAG